MRNFTLFRKTPFNGYNRNDVTEYIVAQDEQIVELQNSLERKVLQCEALTKEVEELKSKEDLSALCAELKQDNDNKDGIITVLDDMSKQEINALKEQLSAKDTEIEILKNEIEKVKAESEELLRSAKIKSDYLVKNAEFFAYTTKEKLLSLQKAVNSALADIDKTIEASEEENEN